MPSDTETLRDLIELADQAMADVNAESSSDVYDRREVLAAARDLLDKMSASAGDAAFKAYNEVSDDCKILKAENARLMELIKQLSEAHQTGEATDSEWTEMWTGVHQIARGEKAIAAQKPQG